MLLRPSFSRRGTSHLQCLLFFTGGVESLRRRKTRMSRQSSGRVCGGGRSVLHSPPASLQKGQTFKVARQSVGTHRTVRLSQKFRCGTSSSWSPSSRRCGLRQDGSSHDIAASLRSLTSCFLSLDKPLRAAQSDRPPRELVEGRTHPRALQRAWPFGHLLVVEVEHTARGVERLSRPRWPSLRSYTRVVGYVVARGREKKREESRTYIITLASVQP